ncbi:MAG: hypothetical protein JST84_01360 [Acidobacteria bacterium]|nr:hypothetical protein [Acidobacteriota bacterium]
MIVNDEQLQQTQHAINNLESGLAALKRDVLPLNAARFAMMAEPVIDQIQELRAQVEEYVGITAAMQVWQLQGHSLMSDPVAERPTA